MRNAVVRLPPARTSGERRQVLRAAVRQLERADIYLAAVAAMEMDDRQARRALAELRGDVDALRRHLIELRAETET
jgi:lysylphosphatidylglycerol synthetase-like protein (DUF2156 family)